MNAIKFCRFENALNLFFPSTSHVSFLFAAQANAFRALRFLFCKERNRKLFKRIFPPDVFETFIDVGHYNRDITAYTQLVAKTNTLDVSSIKTVVEFKKGTGSQVVIWNREIRGTAFYRG